MLVSSALFIAVLGTVNSKETASPLMMKHFFTKNACVCHCKPASNGTVENACSEDTIGSVSQIIQCLVILDELNVVLIQNATNNL